MTRPELLAPAGNLDKLKTAFHFGADAVYAGLDGYSLRARAKGFTVDTIQQGVQIAHDAGGRFYLAVNMMPYDTDLDTVRSMIDGVVQAGPDGLIVSDPGMLRLFRTHGVTIPIHLSTQANVMNSESAAFWFENGVHRIVLARELSIDQIRMLRQRVHGELEVFVHGAVCIAYSGRCFLSRYMTGRSANRGDCAQSCRWAYRELEEEKRPGERYGLESDARGSYIFNATDLCALPVLPDLVKTGVHALKIEGRMRSRHYVAVTVDVYRKALDVLASHGEAAFNSCLSQWVRELEQVGNRRYSTHFLTGNPGEDAIRFSDVTVRNWAAFVGTVAFCDRERLALELANKLHSGETLQLIQPGLRRLTVADVQLENEQGESIPFGQPGMVVYLRVPGDAGIREGDIARR